MKRTASEIIKLKSMPAAQGLIKEIDSLVDKLENLRIEEQELVDTLSFYQLQYKVYLHGEISEQEAIMYKMIGLKLGEDVSKFPYTVIGKDSKDEVI